MKNLLLILLFTPFAFAQAQVDAPKGHLKISGMVKDSLTNQAVEFANVALIDLVTKKPINGSVADDKGKFAITGIAPGTYAIEISFIGFETKRINNLKVTDKNIEIGSYVISPSVETLKEVVVEGQRTLIEEKVDRTVYNAENDKTTSGGDATDVLKRVPMLTVDMDGNVSMRGNQNIRVLINNKPSTIAASSVADALKQIPADQIKSVEVITSPSAKYDAEGSAGIINIITKKNTLQGATLGMDASAGLRGSNLGLNGGYRKGKLGINLGGGGRFGYNTPGGYTNTQGTINNDGTTSVTKQGADTRNNNVMGRYNLGLDYDINKNNSITSSVRYGLRNNNTFQDNLYTQNIQNDLSTYTSLRNVHVVDNSGTVDVNLDYTHLFEKPQRELSLSSQYSQNNRTNDFLNTILNEGDLSTISRLKNQNKSTNQELTVQADYQTPISKNQLLELGGKNIARKVVSDYKYFSATGSDGEFLPLPNSKLTNIFNYSQNITAGYLSYTVSLPKQYSLKAGGRYEYTTINAHYQDEQSIEIPAYGVLVPSANLSKRFKSGNTLKMGYNRRIQRPSIQFLNPNVQASNPLYITVGNPNLSPEYTNNYELSYNTAIKNTSLNFSSFMRNTNNSIQSVRNVLGSDTIKTTYQNIGKEDAYGFSINANVAISSKFSLNGGTDTYYAVLKNNDPNPNYTASNQGWVANFRMMGNYTIKNGWGLQFFGFYRGRQVQLQGYQGAFRVYSLSVRKELKNKKGSFGFGADNFLTPPMKIKNSLTTPIIRQESENVLHNLSFKVSFSYRIGKLNMNGGAPKRKKSVSNDDLKDGGGGGDNQQDAGQQTQQRSGAGLAAGQKPAGTDKKTDTPTVKMDPTAVVKAEGDWTYVIESPQGGGGTLKIVKTGETLSGTIINSRSNRETALTSVVLTGNELTFSYESNFGGNTNVVTFKGIIADNNLNGTMAIGQFGSFPMNAKRAQ